MRKQLNRIFSTFIEINKANKLLINNDIKQDILAPILPTAEIKKKFKTKPAIAELKVTTGIHLVCFKRRMLAKK